MDQPPNIPQADSAVAPIKKGMSPLAWVGIGCGGLVVIAIIVMVVGGIWFTNKAKELGADFSSNPEKAAAELIVNMSPDLEKISGDEEAGTMTIRMKDGSEKTLSYKDISEGKFMEEEAPTPIEEPITEPLGE